MSLSVPNVVAWNFMRASTPLVSQIGQTETITLAGAGISVNTTDGLVLNGTQSLATLNCANGGFLVGWTRPHTFISVMVFDRTGVSNASSAPAWMRYDSTGATPKIGVMNYDASQGRLSGRNNTFNNFSATNVTPNLATCVVISEFTSTGVSLWVDNVSISLGTGSPAVPTLLTTDLIRFGSTDLNNPKMKCRAFAIVPGALTAGDRSAIQTDWQSAIFNPQTITPISAAYHLLRGMR